MSDKFKFSWMLCIAVCVGCSQGWEADYSELGLASVSGRITFDGAPVANSTVIFECADKSYSYGRTDDQGYYLLMFNSEKKGALPGPKVIRIQQGDNGDRTGSAPWENSDATASQSKTAIPACYSSRSQLQATVVGGSQTLDFDLKSNGSTKGPTG